MVGRIYISFESGVKERDGVCIVKVVAMMMMMN